MKRILSVLIGVSFLGALGSVTAWGQDLGATNLGDYVGKERLSPRDASDEERKRLAATYDNGVAAYQHKAYAAFTTLLQSNPEPKISAVIYVARAQSYVGKKELRKAVTDADQAIRLDRNLAVAYNTRGVALGMMGDLHNAIKDFDVTMRLDPRFVDAQRNRALAERYLKSQRPTTKRTTKVP